MLMILLDVFPPKSEDFLCTGAHFQLGKLKKVATLEQGPLWSSTWQDNGVSVGKLGHKFAWSMESGKCDSKSCTTPQGQSSISGWGSGLGNKELQSHSSLTPPLSHALPLPKSLSQKCRIPIEHRHAGLGV